MTSFRWRRLLLGFVLVLLVLVVGGLVAAHFVLSSAYATRKVQAKLEAMLGEKVDVARVHIGMTGDSTLYGVKIYEASADGKQPGPAWFTADEVQADLSALGLLRDAALGELRLQGAKVDLRFDPAGHLLTRLPKSKGVSKKMPRVDLTNGQLTLAQEGHPPLVIHDVQGSVVPKGDDLEVTASVTDPTWADWKLHGTIGLASGLFTAVAESPKAVVTMAKLRALPFIPASVWEEVEAEGTTPVRCTLLHEPGKSGTHYELRLEPRDTRVYIPSIKLRADKAHGTIIVKDERVLLTGVEGRLVDPKGHSTKGVIQTDADMDFASKTDVLNFNVKVKGIGLHDLPKSWSLPKGIDGQLTGDARIVITVGDKVHTSGSGQGVVDPAFLVGFPADPIHLKLVAAGKGFDLRHGTAPRTGARLFTPGLAGTVAILTGPSLGEPPPPAPKATPAPVSPVHWIGKAPDAVLQAAHATVKGAHAVLHPVSRVMHRAVGNKLPAPAKPVDYLEATLGLEDVDLAELVRRLKVTLPFDLTGRLTFHVQVSIPYNTPDDMKAYRLNGTAKLPRLTVAGAEFTDVTARVRYADGILDLDELRGQAPRPGAPAGTVAGTFKGSARYQITPPGDLSANLAVDSVPLDLLLARLPGPASGAWGLLSGTIKLHAPGKTLKDLATWDGAATLRSDRLQVYGLTFTNASASLSLDGGLAKLTRLNADLEGLPVTGSGEAVLKGAYPYQGKLSLGRLDLAALKRLAPSLRPPVPVEGRMTLSASARGTLSPRTVNIVGSASATDLIVNGVKFDSLSFDWSGDAKAVKLSDLKARLYKGDVTGSAVIPLADSAGGSADLRIDKVDAEALSKGFKAFPVRLQGQVSGTLAGTISPAKPGAARALGSKVTLTAPRLRVQGIPADRIEGAFEYLDGAGSYRLQGDTLGGKFKLTGKLPPRPKTKETPGESRAPDGRLEIEGVRLGILDRALRPQAETEGLQGVVYLSLPFRFVGPQRRLAGQGRFQIDDLRWGGIELSDMIEGDVVLTPESIQLRDFDATLGEGFVRGQIVYNLRDRTRSWFVLDLTHVQAAHLLAPYPAAAKVVEGLVNARLRGRLGFEWHGSGTVELTRGKVLGLDVTEWRLPLTFSYSLREDRGEIHLHDSHAQAGGGRLTAQADLHWGGAGVRLAGTVRLMEARIQTLLRSAGSLASYASGRVNARIDLGGSEIRSLNDLVANVSATLREGQVAQLPVLQQLLPSILPGGTSSTAFQTGSLKGRLAGGIFRIQTFTLAGSYLQLFIQGNVTLQGRLDLDAIARTGGDVNRAGCLGSLGIVALPTGALPAILVLRASTFLANQVLRLHVGGTVRSPVIQFQPVRLLAEEAIRFFLTGATFPTP